MDDLPDSVYKKRVDLEELENHIKEVLVGEYDGTVRVDTLFGGGLIGRGRTKKEDAENRPDISISSIEDPEEIFEDFLEEFLDKHDYSISSKNPLNSDVKYEWVINLKPKEIL